MERDEPLPSSRRGDDDKVNEDKEEDKEEEEEEDASERGDEDCVEVEDEVSPTSARGLKSDLNGSVLF